MPVRRKKLAVVEPPAEPPTLAQRLYRIPQVAAYLNCSVWAVRDLLRRRELHKIKLGKKFLVDIQELNSLIERRKAAA